MNARPGFESAPYAEFDYPFVSSTPPGGGTWCAGAAAFQVEEVPLYPFCGEGEHAALRVEKAGLATRDVALRVAGRLKLPPSAVGYAGMKDRDATSIQGFTVTGVTEEQARSAFEAEGCRVLSASRHRNKLRLGHLVGNRFRALLRGTDAAAAREILGELSARGAPNYFGPQRFGAKGDNASAALRVLTGEARANRWRRDLLVSAAQAFIFNEVLARRVEAGTLRRALRGDLLRRADSGGLFLCEAEEADQPRVERLEVSATGPLPGKKMMKPGGLPGELEACVLSDLGVSEALFQRELGTRRALVVPIDGASVEEAPEGIWVSFTAPAGTFATSVLRELTGGNLRRD
ncbi:MAG: tRNA pseudouridine(13) synthase TruD [Deltaproteobacteria bacterium]|nr:tRNA pseudouridine(13) synthase TruD [Deltaproteobacteria bacterium]